MTKFRNPPVTSSEVEINFGPDSVLTGVKIKGVDRPDIKTLDEAIQAAAVLIWAEHPNNPANKVN